MAPEELEAQRLAFALEQGSIATRLALPGLYLCGSGAHPGGGVTGAPGANAAREIIGDLKKRSSR